MSTVQTQRPPATPPVSILMYHQVGEFESPKTHRASYCHIKRFKSQMGYLRRFGYNVISLDQAYRGLFGGDTLPPRAVVLTFDDGYQNFHDYAFPVLKHHGFPATVFIVTQRIGAAPLWLENGDQRPPLMSGATLRALHHQGVNFGSHTRNHVRLSQVDSALMREEISRSRTELEDVLGAPVPDFCYPYGDYNEAARDVVAEAGYRLGLTCIRGAANTADNPFEIPRKAISFGDNLAGYFWKLHMKHERKEPVRLERS